MATSPGDQELDEPQESAEHNNNPTPETDAVPGVESDEDPTVFDDSHLQVDPNRKKKKKKKKKPKSKRGLVGFRRSSWGVAVNSTI